jgi:hypothetical protein
MAHTATLTGNHGPGLTMTAKVFNNITKIEFDLVNNLVDIEYSQPVRNIRMALTGVTTVTDTITNGQHSFVVS